MELAVYCARSWRFSAWRTTGKFPLTCPELTAESLDVDNLRADIVYLRLHGMPAQPFLYGDDWQTALAAHQVKAADFSGSIVFLEGCYGDEMGKAFLAAGAKAVVGSTGTTYGRRWRLGPSSIVGRAWLKMIKRGFTAGDALVYALRKVRPQYRIGWVAHER